MLEVQVLEVLLEVLLEVPLDSEDLAVASSVGATQSAPLDVTEAHTPAFQRPYSNGAERIAHTRAHMSAHECRCNGGSLPWISGTSPGISLFR